MKKQTSVVMGLLFLSCAVGAKTIQVGGEQKYQQVKSNPCWAASVEPIIFVNGLKPGQQRNVSVALGLTADPDGAVCAPCISAEQATTDGEKPAHKPDNEKPVMVWYKDPKTNKKILVNGKHNDLDDEGNLKWQQIHDRKEDCQLRQYFKLNGRCSCASSSGIYQRYENVE